MLKWVASYIANRLFILALVMLAMNAYFRTTCGAGISVVDQVQRALAGLDQISRVLR
jgi:hypothetical protein